jgi:hypothetical protein
MSSNLVNWADVATDLQGTLSSALTSIVPVAVAVFGVLIGWRLLRRFIGR